MSGISVKNESCIMGCQQAGGQMSGIAVKNESCIMGCQQAGG